MALTREQVIAALRTVKDPERGTDIVALNMVKDIRINGGVVHLTLELKDPTSPRKDVIARDADAALRQAGAQGVKVEAGAPGGGPAGTQSAQTHMAAPPSEGLLPQVKNVIAIGAGKGGVGKSTVAVNVAVGLARTGAKVGLMDGDIYGPSMPTMLGIKGRVPEVLGAKIKPFDVHGILAVTIGALVDQDKPLIWRGPMAHGAFKQLFSDNVAWPTLDYLIVDLPPGTGDVPLTLCQLLPLAGAVVVATPQQVALDDAIRAVHMFEQLHAPVLGIVENMSVFVDATGKEHDLFGRGGAQKAAQNLGVPYLGEIPMFIPLRVNSDAGDPKANFEGDERLKQALETIVTNLVSQINVRKLQRAAPKLNVI